MTPRGCDNASECDDPSGGNEASRDNRGDWLHDWSDRLPRCPAPPLFRLRFRFASGARLGNKTRAQLAADIKKPPTESQWSLSAWQRPTLPGPCGPSTIGAGGLNGRVRDGYAWNPSAIATKQIRYCTLKTECESCLTNHLT